MAHPAATADEREYLLGTHDAELIRLGFQHQVWSAHAVRGWERAGFRLGQRLLDVGCGPGYTTFDLARLVGDAGEVVAVDLSRRFVGYLAEQARARGLSSIETRIQDVERLDLPPESFDGAFTRWVLCFVSDPAATVAGVARALRPGASFVVQDYLRYPAITMAPRSDAFSQIVDAVVRSWRARGGDPEIGIRIPAMMTRAGLKVTSVHPIVRVARPGTSLWQWPETFFTGYVPNLVESGLVTPDDADAFWRDWRDRSADPAAFLLTPPMVEVIGTKV